MIPLRLQLLIYLLFPSATDQKSQRVVSITVLAFGGFQQLVVAVAFGCWRTRSIALSTCAACRICSGEGHLGLSAAPFNVFI
jgi:hypothetical protein